LGSSSTTTSSRACRFIALHDPYAYTPDDLRERLRGEGYGEDPENVSTIRNIQIKFETHEGGGQTLTVREDIPSDYTDHLNAILAAGPSNANRALDKLSPRHLLTRMTPTQAPGFLTNGATLLEPRPSGRLQQKLRSALLGKSLNLGLTCAICWKSRPGICCNMADEVDWSILCVSITWLTHDTRPAPMKKV
jgi:hypothetical protein